MEHRSEHTVVKRLGDLRFHLETLHISIVELCLTGKILFDGRSRESHLLHNLHIPVSLLYNILAFRDFQIITHHGPVHERILVLVLQLLDVPAFLT